MCVHDAAGECEIAGINICSDGGVRGADILWRNEQAFGAAQLNCRDKADGPRKSSAQQAKALLRDETR